jgi:CrcB protein
MKPRQGDFMTLALLVGCGGFFGSICRFLIGSTLSPHVSHAIPYHTLIINLVGSFLIGVALVYFDTRNQPNYFYLLLPGFLGGFTTFSAFSAETLKLIDQQLYVPAVSYVVISLLGGIFFCFIGSALAKSIH